MHTNDMLTGPRLCACVKIETVFMNDHSICLNRLEQAPLPKCICTCERVTFSAAIRAGHAGALHYSVLQSRKNDIFGSFLELKIAFLDLSPQRQVGPGHPTHVITLLSKLYQQTYTVSSQPPLFPT